MYSVALHFQFSVNAIESKHVWAVSLVCIWAHLLTKYFICGVIWSFDVYWQLFVPQTWGPQPICFPFSRVYTRCCWEGLLVVREISSGWHHRFTCFLQAARLVPGIQVASHYKIKDFPTGAFEKHWNGYPLLSVWVGALKGIFSAKRFETHWILVDWFWWALCFWSPDTSWTWQFQMNYTAVETRLDRHGVSKLDLQIEHDLNGWPVEIQVLFGNLGCQRHVPRPENFSI